MNRERYHHFLYLQFYKLKRPLKVCHFPRSFLAIWTGRQFDNSRVSHGRGDVH